MPRGKKREVGETKQSASSEGCSEALRLILNASEKLHGAAKAAMAEGDMAEAGRLFVAHAMTKDLEWAIRSGDPDGAFATNIREAKKVKPEKQLDAFDDGHAAFHGSGALRRTDEDGDADEKNAAG